MFSTGSEGSDILLTTAEEFPKLFVCYPSRAFTSLLKTVPLSPCKRVRCGQGDHRSVFLRHWQMALVMAVRQGYWASRQSLLRQRARGCLVLDINGVHLRCIQGCGNNVVLKVEILDHPSLRTTSSMSAYPSPIMTPPSICPSTHQGV